MRLTGLAALGTAVSIAVVLSACGTSGDASGNAATTASRPTDQRATDQRATARPSTDALTSFGAQLLDETGATGAVLGLRRGSTAPIVVAVGHGATADGAEGTPVTPSDPLHVASVTKSYVAALSLVLETEDLVALDAPIATWLSWPGGDRITLRHLLTHTSGVGRFGDGESPSPYLDLIARGRPVTTAEALDAARAVEPLGVPGAATRYGNLNYLLAGAVLEAAAGAPLHELLRDRLFGASDLDHTWYPPEQPEQAAPPTGLFEVAEDLPPVLTTDVPLVAWQTATGGASGAIATVDDLLVWSDTVFRRREVAGVDLSAMTDIGPGGYGLGVIGLGSEGDCVFDGCPPGVAFERWALNGDFPGASTRVVHDPATDTTVVVHLNRNALDLDPALDAFLDRG